jgi:hypothetical protein
MQMGYCDVKGGRHFFEKKIEELRISIYTPFLLFHLLDKIIESIFVMD